MDVISVPDLDAVVEVLVGSGALCVGPYRVDDRRGEIVVLDPLPEIVDLPQVDDPEPGDVVRLRWAGHDEVVIAEAQVVRVAPGEPWWLRLVGRVDVPHRRSAHRRSVDGPVAVSRDAEPAAAPLPGRLVDVAVGGLRCLLGPDAGAVAEGERVTVRLDLDRRRYAVSGRVVRTSDPLIVAGSPRVEVAVAFDDPLPPADPAPQGRPRGYVPPPR